MSLYARHTDERWREGEDHPFYITNIMPRFGREHEFTTECWCHPEVERFSNGDIIVHNVMH